MADVSIPDVSASGEQPAPLFPDVTRDDVFRLETRRLWLRWQRHGDAASLHAFAGLREVAEMTGTWPHPLPDGEAERRIFSSRKVNATGAGLILGLTPRGKPAQQIGSIGITASLKPDTFGQPELGYMLHPDHRGQGLAAEGAAAILDIMFRYTAVPAVRAWVRVTNAASRRVLEKCGFRQCGSALLDQPARGGVVPCDAFVLDRQMWASLEQRW